MRRKGSGEPTLFDGAPECKRIPESVVMRQARAYLRGKNVYHQRTNAGQIITREGHVVKLCDEGTPDLYSCHRGISLWIECKAEGEKPGSKQLEEHGWLMRAGAMVIVAYNNDDIRRALLRIDEMLNALARRLGVERFYTLTILEIIDQAIGNDKGQPGCPAR